MNTGLQVRPALPEDAEAIARIYNYYIRNTVITFEEEPVSTQTMAGRVAEVHRESLPWLVADQEDPVVGFAYANKWKVRSAYRYSVPNEASVALHRQLGFEHVATFHQVGFKHDRWVDVAYRQIVL